jgi:CBS domain-containing protein
MTPEDMVGRIMTIDVKTIDVKEPAKKAVDLMASKEIGDLVVTRDRKPAGMVTERDILRKISSGVDIQRATVEDIMSSPLITVKTDTTAIEALETIFKNNIRRLPVIDAEKLVGIVTERDLFRWVLKVAYG